MAYQGYSDQPGNYGQSQPYGGPSPYQQAGNPYDQNTSYNGGDPYAQGQYDRQGYEMNNVAGSGQNRILNECQEINKEVVEYEKRQDRLRMDYQSLAREVNTEEGKERSRRTAADSSQLVQDYQQLVARTKRIKQDKESGSPRNKAQVGATTRKVQESMNRWQRLDAEARKEMQAISARAYEIVNPDASEAEKREATQDPSAPIFAQAIRNSNRTGQAQSILGTVNQRHEAIQKIEKDMVQLAAMFQDLDALVVQQEATVAAIEERGEETVVHGNKGVEELGGAVDKARAARKKKFICLGIGIAIVVVIVVVVVVVVEVVKK